MARLIDVNDALEKLCEHCSCGDYEECDFRCSEFENISNIPTVDAVEVVHGRWFMRGGRFRCSECDAVALLKLDINVGGYREYGHFRSSYCPNCGARLDGDSNG